MKKAIVYTLLPVLLLSFAAGCGMADRGKDRPVPSPAVSASPQMTGPDAGDGIVNDTDGIITDEDNGMIPGPTASSESRPGAVSPSASPSMTPNV